MKPRRLFLAGATGAVGRVLLPLAVRHGVAVVAHVRPKSAGALQHAPLAQCELADTPALVKGLEGCTTVVQLIGTMRARFGAGDTYETSDVGTTRQLVEAAKQAGVDHLVLLSSVGAGTPVGAYLQAKARAEALVRGSGLDFTIVRPSSFADREGTPKLVAALRGLTPARFRPITLAELASAILRVANERAPVGVALEGQPLWDVVDAAAALRG